MIALKCFGLVHYNVIPFRVYSVFYCQAPDNRYDSSGHHVCGVFMFIHCWIASSLRSHWFVWRLVEMRLLVCRQVDLLMEICNQLYAIDAEWLVRLAHQKVLWSSSLLDQGIYLLVVCLESLMLMVGLSLMVGCADQSLSLMLVPGVCLESSGL